MDQKVASTALTTFGELMECLDVVPGRSQMPQGTSQPGKSRMKLGSGMPGLAPATELDSSPMLNAKPIEPVCIYPNI